MAIFSLPWAIRGALLTTAYLHSVVVAASPSINVELQTSFSSAPYLVELLETAAEENATSYFPLLDRIADGYFAGAHTDKDLFEKFVQLLKDDGHLTEPESFSSYKLALSLHSAAPRIEAHYQYYHTAVEPELTAQEDSSCPTWVQFGSHQYCSPELEKAHGEYRGESQPENHLFDRVIGNSDVPGSVLYADITSPTFGLFHKTLIRTAREGKTSYRIRHRKPLSSSSTPLIIGGYGVELQLKRTDYIVIDDRDNDAKAENGEKPETATLADEEVADLKPLSKSQLASLDLKAASFVMQSEDPFQALIKLTQDFPKYSSAMAAHNATTEFIEEHVYNRAQVVPAGINVMWMNGLQIAERQIDAFSLLNILRKERQLINGVKEIGLSGPEAVSLLGHEMIALAQADDEPERYDWTDQAEGGNVIIWLNDIEKDKRYEGWATSINSLLQRTYPGQLPAVRRDIFNLVLPVDLTKSEDVYLVAEQIRSFVKRKIPVRFGVVPITKTDAAVAHAKIVYYLQDAYGIAVALRYLEGSLSSKSLDSASKSQFDAAIKDKPLRRDKEPIDFDDVLASEFALQRIQNSQKWASRLAADGSIPPFIINGVALPRTENWLPTFSGRINVDLQTIQQAVFEERLDSTSWLPSFYLEKALKRRNSLIIPEDETSLTILNLSRLEDLYTSIPDRLSVTQAEDEASKAEWAHLVVVADLSNQDGQDLVNSAKLLRDVNPGVELAILDNPVLGEVASGIPFINAMGLAAGQSGLLLNGRFVGPILKSSDFEFKDFEQLLKYERAYRITPVYSAMEALGLSDRISNPFVGAKISSIVALSTVSDSPGGIYEQPSTLRIGAFNAWQSKYTAIEVGDSASSAIRITASVDPASEVAQRWVPILKVLSELDGVYLKLFLNPKDRLQELPVKRFYRYVLDSEPKFSADGALLKQGAIFNGVPQEALLNLGMDVPPPWLVAPKKSVHDLDNIKLSSVKSDVDALYELEHILIEGHSREMPHGAAPRGAQLVLGTNREPHFADTIIMANLGYFQFKANPGYYKISLQEGRSSQIFEIDSLGVDGWAVTPGDNSTNIALMSFQGTTLYPRLSRRLGQESEDVLETKVNTAIDTAYKGLKQAQSLFGFGKKEVATTQADINIFSVASGHLYERMLNIMMVSVMKHTKHTVKFWFIEQFLSPSFKDFIPHLAAEYGFQYEMVTYKWPHWLRSQTEKQREIWGYKILFLDVLFPLSLDKVIFVDADQIVRTDMIELVNHDLKGAPYGFTPMCDSRTEMEGFRFWKQGYWKNFLKGLPYHISALYVVDLKKFRQIAAGDRLRQQYHQLSADPGSLSNLDQDLPNHMQSILPIHSLPQEWLWCETWCSDESLKDAKTIDLCNNPQTKEPKLDRARRQVPEWTVYDDEIAAVDRKRKGIEEEKPDVVKNTKSRNHEEL